MWADSRMKLAFKYCMHNNVTSHLGVMVQVILAIHRHYLSSSHCQDSNHYTFTLCEEDIKLFITFGDSVWLSCVMCGGALGEVAAGVESNTCKYFFLLQGGITHLSSHHHPYCSDISAYLPVMMPCIVSVSVLECCCSCY